MEQIQQQQQSLLLNLAELPTKIIVTCITCNKEILRYRSHYLRSPESSYCSRLCFAYRLNTDRNILKKREIFTHKYDRFFRCSLCEKWIPKENAKWHKTKQLNKPRCPDCNTLLKQSPRNAKFKKQNK